MGTSNQAAAAQAENTTDRVTVYLGNRDAVEDIEDPADIEAAARDNRAPNRVRRALPGKRCTTVTFPAGTRLVEAVYQITHPTNGVFAAHSNAEAPAWVAATNPVWAQLLAATYGCEVREVDTDATGG